MECTFSARLKEKTNLTKLKVKIPAKIIDTELLESRILYPQPAP